MRETTCAAQLVPNRADVADWLRTKYPKEFGGECTQVIHTKNNGEIKETDLEVARKAQRDRLFNNREDAERWLDQYLARTYPLITGQDLIDRGLSPGTALGKLLKEARALQSRRELRSRDDALAWLDERIRRHPGKSSLPN